MEGAGEPSNPTVARPYGRYNRYRRQDRLFLTGTGGRGVGAALQAAKAAGTGEGGATVEPCATLGVEIAELVHSYRELGHIIANLDPLGHNRTTHPLLELSEFGLTLNDLDNQCGTG